MKKRIYLIVSLLVITAAVLILFSDKVSKAAGGVFGLVTGVSNPPAQSGEIIATSTLNYLTIGAGTTTVTVNTSGTDALDVNVFVHASSTASNLRWRVEFSHSTSTVDSERVWFNEPIELTINATTTVITRTAKEYSWMFASTTTHRLATSTAMVGTFDQNTTNSFVFRIKDIAAQWTRIIFYNPTGSATDARMDTLTEVTSLGIINTATSTSLGIQVFVTQKQPL